MGPQTDKLWDHDKTNLFVFWLTVAGFAISSLGLCFLPVGDDAAYRSSLRFTNPMDDGGMDLMDMHFLVPEQHVPLFWVGIIWPVLTGLLALAGSHYRQPAVLLYALVFVGISASLLLLCSHILTVVTYNCRFCDSPHLPDGVYDSTPDELHDNCPSFGESRTVTVHGQNFTYGKYNWGTTCNFSHAFFVLGASIMLLAMYVFLFTIERRRRIVTSLGDPLKNFYSSKGSSYISSS